MTDETKDESRETPETPENPEGGDSGGGPSAPGLTESGGATERPSEEASSDSEGEEKAPAAESAAGEGGSGASDGGSSEGGEDGSEESAEEGEGEGESEEERKAAAEAKVKAAAEAKAKAEAAAKAKAEAEAKRAAEEAAKDPWERDPQDPEWVEEDEDPLVEALRRSQGEAVLSARSFAGELTLEIRPEAIREVATALKEEHGYLLPVDICGAHYPDREEGEFEVVYHLYNFDANRRIRLKVKTDEDREVPSVTPVWRGANWPEREVYDMFGVRFSDHPDMTRILLWEGFNGYPLRKDFPVEGIDTGTAIYPEYYEEEAGPIAGTGTGWKAPEPPEPEGEDAEASSDN